MRNSRQANLSQSVLNRRTEHFSFGEELSSRSAENDEELACRADASSKSFHFDFGLTETEMKQVEGMRKITKRLTNTIPTPSQSHRPRRASILLHTSPRLTTDTTPNSQNVIAHHCAKQNLPNTLDRRKGSAQDFQLERFRHQG